MRLVKDVCVQLETLSAQLTHNIDVGDKICMLAFLRNHRATPHVTTNQSPLELFYGREVNIKKPTPFVKSKSIISLSKAKIMDKQRKRKMESYADRYKKSKIENRGQCLS